MMDVLPEKEFLALYRRWQEETSRNLRKSKKWKEFHP